MYGVDSEQNGALVADYLQRLHLHHKVKVENGRFSSVNLSQGQHKRLALLVAYLEDRAFYVFDEWAADQDPEFKHLFYTELLPALKARGKTVLIISHDDRYFYLADRCIKLEEKAGLRRWKCQRRLMPGSRWKHGAWPWLINTSKKIMSCVAAPGRRGTL